MARWRKTFLLEVAGKLQQLGLTRCPVCQGERIGALPHPIVALVGGLPPKASNVEDPEVTTDYLVRIECFLCGHILLFNAEQFRTGDDAILISGLTEQEEAELEQQDPL